MLWNDIKNIKDVLMSINGRLHNIEKSLIDLEDRINQDSIQLGMISSTQDKLDDYMKNVDKVNLLVNEFKGCVAMSTASLADKKKLKKKKAISI